MTQNFSLRPYQIESAKAVFHEWKEGNRKTLLVLPTGTGKTIVFANIAKIAVEHNQRVLILAHRWELLQQAQQKIKSATGLDSAIEKAELKAIQAKEMITIASMQTLSQDKRLHEYPKDYFQVIIIDEAHHALSPSYQKIFQYFNNAFVLGVTATAQRGDQKELGTFFDSLAYEYTLNKAVEDGFLVPLTAMTIPLRLDISNVKMQNGDYQVGDLGNVLEPYLEQIADEMKKVCMDRKTIVFLPLIRISQKFRDILNDHGFRAVEVNGNSTDREEILKKFEDGTYNVICNSMLLTEGFDCPSIDCVVVLRPTKVSGLYRQMIGRGTRLSDGKDNLLILDFLWMSSKHELCHPASLVAKNQQIETAMIRTAEAGDPYDLQELAEETERDILAQRKKSLARELALQRNKQRRILNPLEVGLMLDDTNIADYEPTYQKDMDRPTEKQLDVLDRFGMDIDTITSKGQATLLIKTLIQRSDKNLSTLKQIRFLDSRGFQNVAKWTFDEASRMMTTIANNHWNIPSSINPKTFVPASLQRKRKKKK